MTALILSLETYLDDLDESIAAAGTTAGSGDGYFFLDQLQADKFTMTIQGEATAEVQANEDELAAAILTSYASLFDTGDGIQAGIPDVDTDAISGQSDAIKELEQGIQKLSAQLEAEDAQLRQLTQKRDLAWNTYDTLSNKVVELDLERTASNREVRAGTEATVPLQSVPGRSPLTASIIGGIIGLLLGMLMAFVMDYQGKEPPLARSRQRGITFRLFRPDRQTSLP